MKISRKQKDQEEIREQDFLDMIAPSTIRFYTDYFICGNTFRSVWALREYPTVTEELVRCKLNVDRLILQQKRGFQTVIPGGRNEFGEQFERVLPASSVANLYPFNYSGKTDTCGFYIGKDKYGSNVLVDFNQRAEDKTNGSILILGNSGQGKSYLLKLILCNLREAGMRILCLDPEMEYKELTQHMDGCFVDLMDGSYMINPLEPKMWAVGEMEENAEVPKPFRTSSQLSQHG